MFLLPPVIAASYIKGNSLKSIVIIFLILLVGCSSTSRKAKIYKPLKEITFETDVKEETFNVTTFSDEYFEKDKFYILDLYFILANDAFYMGCYEIAHNGFIFLYKNDPREGVKEFISMKLAKMRQLLLNRAYAREMGLESEYDRRMGLHCQNLKESLDE